MGVGGHGTSRALKHKQDRTERVAEHTIVRHVQMQGAKGISAIDIAKYK
jgi:hypothetical protein